MTSLQYQHVNQTKKDIIDVLELYRGLTFKLENFGMLCYSHSETKWKHIVQLNHFALFFSTFWQFSMTVTTKSYWISMGQFQWFIKVSKRIYCQVKCSICASNCAIMLINGRTSHLSKFFSFSPLITTASFGTITFRC